MRLNIDQDKDRANDYFGDFECLIFVLFSYRLDVYRKVESDLTQPTTYGALLFLTCILFIVFLFISELYAFLSVEL